MRYNGSLRYQIIPEDAAGVNEFGEPLERAAEWSEPLPCFISAVSDNRKAAYEDGEYRQASWSILVEKPIKAERVELTMQGEKIGEYRVISRQRLNTFGRMVINV